jgi:hypothetical protein
MSPIISDFNSGFWAFAIIAGPVILAVALWIGIRESRRRTRRPGRVPGTEIPGSPARGEERGTRAAP